MTNNKISYLIKKGQYYIDLKKYTEALEIYSKLTSEDAEN